MPDSVFTSGPFRGVPADDAFALAASSEAPVVVDLGRINWPPGLKPVPAPLGGYRPGQKIIGAISANIDVLIVLYTELETSALLDVFTGDKSWTPQRRAQWCGYAHNFAPYKSGIAGIDGNDALEQGLFGYLSAVRIGTKTVALYKSELHPKQNGPMLPFIPVMRQLITELAPSLVITTGTAGAVGPLLQCGDVVVNTAARFHCREHYPDFPAIEKMVAKGTRIANSLTVDTRHIDYAANHFTRLSLPGLAECHARLEALGGYGFVKKSTSAPEIFVTGKNPVPSAEPMATVSADYLTVDDNHDSEGLQALGNVNDTDDAFLFYAIDGIRAAKPNFLSIRNVSEPQIIAPSFPSGTSQSVIVDKLKGIGGRIYGIYQYCTTLNSAFACWAVVAGL